MPTKHKSMKKSMSHKGKSHKGKSHKGKTHKHTMKSMHSSTGASEMPGYCVHERKHCTMVDCHKKVITMKNGNKRAMMEGKCKSCGKKVTKFVKM